VPSHHSHQNRSDRRNGTEQSLGITDAVVKASHEQLAIQPGNDIALGIHERDAVPRNAEAGDRHEAQDVAQEAFARALARWSRLGSYELPVSMDILRGRYRDDPANPSAIPAGKIVGYTLKLPHADHVFLPGHRIMVQIQSTWFPLYDRNPQTFVPNIFDAKPQDFVKATQRFWHEPGEASYISLPVVAAQ